MGGRGEGHFPTRPELQSFWFRSIPLQKSNSPGLLLHPWGHGSHGPHMNPLPPTTPLPPWPDPVHLVASSYTNSPPGFFTRPSSSLSVAPAWLHSKYLLQEALPDFPLLASPPVSQPGLSPGLPELGMGPSTPNDLGVSLRQS